MSGAGRGLPPHPVTAWPGYDVERTSVRVVLLDADGRLLLFRTRDPSMPWIGEWWELPGGGMEPGEDVAATAVRELSEETGFVVRPDEVSAPTWRRSATYVRRFVRTLQHELVVSVRLRLERPPVSRAGRTEEELEQYAESRWWDVADVDRIRRAFLPRLAAGPAAADTWPATRSTSRSSDGTDPRRTIGAVSAAPTLRTERELLRGGARLLGCGRRGRPRFARRARHRRGRRGGARYEDRTRRACATPSC